MENINLDGFLTTCIEWFIGMIAVIFLVAVVVNIIREVHRKK